MHDFIAHIIQGVIDTIQNVGPLHGVSMLPFIPFFTGTIGVGEDIVATDFVTSSAGAGDAGKVVVTDANGKIDGSFFNLPLTSLPKPEVVDSGALATLTISSNTASKVGLITIPYAIQTNVLFIKVTSISVQGTFKIGLFNQDGQTRIFTASADCGASAGIVAIPLGATYTLAAGNYYMMIVGVSTTNFNTYGFTTTSTGTYGTDSLYGDGSNLTAFEGTYTVSAGTIPTTITLASISGVASSTLVSRFAKLTTITLTYIYDTAGSFTWTAPTGASTVAVECWGAGGGGAYGGANPAVGTGGGGGAYSKKNSYSVTPASGYTVVVGAGGATVAAGNNGNDGGDSYFVNSSTVMAKGGGGGKFGNPGTIAGGIGGLASSGVGDTKYDGGDGGASTSQFGTGGGSSAGTASAGADVTTDNATGATAPSGGGNGGNGGPAGGGGGSNMPGTAPGGGGGGSAQGGSNNGTGATGKVKITATITL